MDVLTELTPPRNVYLFENNEIVSIGLEIHRNKKKTKKTRIAQKNYIVYSS